jgi:Spy/CpxP family protein refolding chaperone
MSERESTSDPVDIKESLDDIVQKLERGTTSSSNWNESTDANKEAWEQLKNKIQQCQRALKQLVTDKKAGLIGADEFDRQYPKLQDELTELETAVYNMKLGTDVK